jgi:hypothetical protein
MTSYITNSIRSQDALFLSQINDYYKDVAKRAITRYSRTNPFYPIVVAHRRDLEQLKIEIDKALIKREIYLKNILSEFKS